jgi:hypothetical protein
MEQYLKSVIYEYKVEIKYWESCGFWIITINVGELYDKHSHFIVVRK